MRVRRSGAVFGCGVRALCAAFKEPPHHIARQGLPRVDPRGEDYHTPGRIDLQADSRVRGYVLRVWGWAWCGLSLIVIRSMSIPLKVLPRHPKWQNWLRAGSCLIALRSAWRSEKV